MVDQLHHGSHIQMRWVVVVLVVAFIIAVLSKMERLPDIDEVFQSYQRRHDV